MDTTVILWLLLFGVFGSLIVFARYLKHQDRPPEDKHHHTPAE
jgi:hypothetical protein